MRQVNRQRALRGLLLVAVVATAVIFQNCAPMEGFGVKEEESNGSSGLNLPPGVSQTASVAAYTNTLYPVLRQNCAPCHGATQNPQFAVQNASQGHDTLVSLYLVDLYDPSASYLEDKIRGGHNSFPMSLADSIHTQIVQWVALITPGNDVILPTVSLTAPVNAATVSGTITVSAQAMDNVGVVGVQFVLDGASVGAEDLTAPYQYVLSTGAITNGSHLLSARARDAAGNMGTAANVTFTVNNASPPPPDTMPPAVTIASPASGATLSGSVTLSANASDNVGVVGVQFLLDGTNLGSEDTSSPYSYVVNTAGLTNGSHVLSARARDAAGNLAISAGVTITINNAPPPPSGDVTAPTTSYYMPINGSLLGGAITIKVNAWDAVGVVGVQLSLDGANLGAEDTAKPYQYVLDTTTLSNGPHSINARARDAAGNVKNLAISVTVNNAADTTAPSVSLSNPAAGSVSGLLNLTANATDNVGISGVQFLLDGVVLGYEVLAPPFVLPFESVGMTNGSHTLAVRARDAKGNRTTSANVSITVSNSVSAPQAKFAWIHANILVPKCLSCHNSTRLYKNVDYTDYASTMATGYVKAGSAAQSYLFIEVNGGAMPEYAPKLPAAEISAIQTWIQQGAQNN